MTSSDDHVEAPAVEVLNEETLSAAYQRWQAPRMVSVSDVDADRQMLTVDAIETLQQQAQEEGYKAGFEEGHKAGFKAGQQAGEQDIRQQLAQLRTITEALRQPLAEIDRQLEQDLVRLAITMCRQLLRRELRQEPEHVIGAMRAALQALPVNDRRVTVHVHPQDLALIQKGLGLQADDGQWHWVEDPLLSRGGVRLETADTSVDATVEARLNSIISQLLGEERDGIDD